MAWMDSLRGLAIFLVLSAHASLVLKHFGAEPWAPAAGFNLLFAPYRMAMLMLLSGLLLGPSLRKPPREFVLRKVGSLLWPYVLWTGVYGLAVHEAGVLHLRLWAGASYLWFILFLFSFYLVALALRRVPPGVLVLASFAVSAAAPDGTKYLERYFFLMGFFFIGALLQQRPAWLEELASSRKVLIPSALLAIGLCAASLLRGGINYEVLYAAPALAGIVLLIAIAKSASATRWARALAFVGRHSVVWFVTHYLVIYAVMAIAVEQGLRDAPALIYFLSLGAGALASHAMVVLRERVPFTEALYALPLGRLRRRKPAAAAVSMLPEDATPSMLPGSK